jgi:hypothetical protein
MIANKHTEMRIFSNLNELIENGLSKQELTQKIHRFTYDYLMEYIDIQRTEEGRELFDIFEELGDYHLHTLEIAKRIRDNILGSIDYLDPKKYTKAYKSDLLEDIENKVVDNYFKELNGIIDVFDYMNKIDKLKKKDKKKQLEDNIEDIEFIVSSRIRKAYESYMENNDNDMQKVIDNFELVEWVREDILQDILSSINEYFENDLDIKKSDIESIFNKKMKAFIKEKQGVINAKQKEVYGEQVQINNTIKIPKTVKLYAISKIWEDITK